jgi:CBS domain-containing protein
MRGHRDEPDDSIDEAYFDGSGEGEPRVFDAGLLQEQASVLPTRRPLVFSERHTVSEAMRAMRGERRGVVVVTADGTPNSRIAGIFTERDVLFRVVDCGRNPADLLLSEVMTRDPECLGDEESIARVLHMMSVGGFRHVPVVDAEKRPRFVVSVRDVVQFLVNAFPREVLTLRDESGAGVPRQREGG